MAMILIVCFVSYGSLEMAVRGLGLPDPVLIRNIEKELPAPLDMRSTVTVLLIYFERSASGCDRKHKNGGL
jgi:hypothetical protein